jgi:hypothetical protein
MLTPVSISVVSGEPQSEMIGTAFAKPLVAKVTDANGNPVSGVTVTFLPQGQGAFCTFAGGVNTAVTDGSGNATSATITAGGTDGNYTVAAWAGTVGPVNFRLTNTLPGIWSQGSAAIISATWTTAKAQLATILADAATLATDLAALEASCDTLYSVGAGDIVDFLRQRVRQARLGYQPRPSISGNTAPGMVSVWAPDPKTPRDTTSVDARPITATATGQFCQLS